MQSQDYLLFSSCFIIITAFPLWARISLVYYIYYILLITLRYSKGNVSIMVRCRGFNILNVRISNGALTF